MDLQSNGRKSGLIAAAAFLMAFLTAVSFVLVFSVAVNVSNGARTDMVLCVTPGEPQRAADRIRVAAPESRGDSEMSLTVRDDDKIWATNTRVNIFDHKDPHVGSDGTGLADHVIAPGTSNEYNFTLLNDKKNDVRYSLEIKGVSDSGYYIPVDVEIFDSEGKSLTDGYVDIQELNVLQGGYLPEYSEKPFKLYWKWDFEAGDDVHDTMLGDAAVTEEIPCSIEINVVAEYVTTPGDTSEQRSKDPGSDPESEPGSEPGSDPDKSPEPSDKPVVTGDSTNVPMIVAILIVCGLLTAIALKKGSSKKRTDDAE